MFKVEWIGGESDLDVKTSQISARKFFHFLSSLIFFKDFIKSLRGSMVPTNVDEGEVGDKKDVSKGDFIVS
jgi:hypothetical protein